MRQRKKNKQTIFLFEQTCQFLITSPVLINWCSQGAHGASCSQGCLKNQCWTDSRMTLTARTMSQGTRSQMLSLISVGAAVFCWGWPVHNNYNNRRNANCVSVGISVLLVSQSLKAHNVTDMYSIWVGEAEKGKADVTSLQMSFWNHY